MKMGDFHLSEIFIKYFSTHDSTDKSAYFYQCCPDTTMYFCWTSGFQDALNYLIIWAICFKPMS